MDLTPKRLILDLLATVPQSSMPVGALVAAGYLFGISENNIRVTLARLRAARMIDTDERGRYQQRVQGPRGRKSPEHSRTLKTV